MKLEADVKTGLRKQDCGFFLKKYFRKLDSVASTLAIRADPSYECEREYVSAKGCLSLALRKPVENRQMGPLSRHWTGFSTATFKSG